MLQLRSLVVGWTVPECLAWVLASLSVRVFLGVVALGRGCLAAWCIECFGVTVNALGPPFLVTLCHHTGLPSGIGDLYPLAAPLFTSTGQ